MIWFVAEWNSAAGPERVEVPEWGGEPVEAQVRRFAEIVTEEIGNRPAVGSPPPHLRRPGHPANPLTRLVETSYRTHIGARVAVMTEPLIPEDEAEVEAARKALQPRIDAAIFAGEIQSAAAIDRELTAKIQRARGLTHQRAITQLLLVFPQLFRPEGD